MKTSAKLPPAELPPPTVGHRVVLKDGRVIPIVLTYSFGGLDLFYRASVDIEPAPGEKVVWVDTTTATTEERAVDNMVKNITMSMPVMERLAPGQKTRAELESEIEALKRLSKQEHP